MEPSGRRRRRRMGMKGRMGTALLLLLALCAPPPSSAAPPPSRLCAPPPPPAPPTLTPTPPPDCEETPEGTSGTPLGTSGTSLGTPRATNCSRDPPGGDSALVAPGGDIEVGGTARPGDTGGPGDTLGHLNEAPGDATTTVSPVPVSSGGDKVLVATQADVAMEVTARPGDTGGPGDTVGHLNEAPGDATTVMAPVTTTPGGDKVLVGTNGDVAMEVTGDPGATNDPRNTLGHLNEAHGDATTTMSPVPVSSGGDKVLVGTNGDVAMEGTAQPGATNCSWDALGRVPDVPGDATTMVTSVTTSPGSDRMLVASGGDIAMEGTEGTRVLCGPGDTVGHLNEVYGDATTVVAFVTTSPGGDKVLVGTNGDVGVEGTEDPSVTAGPGDTLGHLNEAPGDATTTVSPVPVSSGGDKVLVGTNGDVAMEVTGDPGATSDPRDTLGHLNEAPADATTVVAPVTTTPGGDKVPAATSGDWAMEGTEDPDATGGPGDTLGHLNETPGDATTTVTSVTTSPGSDKLLVATQSDVGVEGTEDPDATGGPGDTLGHLNEVHGDATTTVSPVPASPGSDRMLVANGGDIAMEGTAQPGATNCSWDALGRVPDVPGDATTVVAPVTTTPGGDKVLVGTNGDVAMEVTGDPGATSDPRDTLGHLNEVYGDATTTVTSVPVSPGSDRVLVASGGDIAMEGTEGTRVLCGPGDTVGHLNEAPGDATTVVAPVTTTPGGDKALVGTNGDVAMEVTGDPGATNDPGDTLGHLSEASGHATTVVTFVTTSPGGDKVLVATQSDVGVEGTAQPGVTGGPGDTLGHLNEAPGDATTVVTFVTTPPGGDKVLVGTNGDVATEGTEDPGVTGGPGDTLGHLNEAPGDATTAVPAVPASPGGGKVLVGTQGDVAMEGTARPGVTDGPGDTLGHLSETPGDATTMVSPVPVSPGGDRVLVATNGDVAMEVTAQPGVTGGPGDTLGHLNEAPRDATTAVPAVPTPPGSAAPPLSPRDDVTVAPPNGPNCSWDSLGRVPEVTTPPDPMTSPPASSAPPRGDAIMVAPGGDVIAGEAPPPCRGPAPHAAFPVTAAPPPGLASSAPSPSWPRPLLLLLLPLPLLLP